VSDVLDRALLAVMDMPRETQFIWHDVNASPDNPEATADFVRRAWPIWPLGQRSTAATGLRILPGQTVDTWPQVDGSGDVSGVMSSAAATAVPLAGFAWILGTNSTDQALQGVRDTWAAQRAAVEPLHRVLGGDSESLDVLESMVFDDDLPLMSSLVLKKTERRPLENRLLRRLDSAPENIRFRDFAEAQFESTEALPIPGDLGVWENFATAMAFGRGYVRPPRKSYRNARSAFEPIVGDLAWRLLHLAPQFDLGSNPRHADHRNVTGGVSSAKAVAAAMAAVSTAGADRLDVWSKSPLFQAVLLPASQDSGGDWHHGYMEAAAGYDGLDEPEIAWNLLCAGAFWVNRRGGNWRAYFDAALALSQRREWVDCVAALENMAERAKLD